MFTLTANKMRLGTHRDKKCVRCEVLVKIVRMGLFCEFHRNIPSNKRNGTIPAR